MQFNFNMLYFHFTINFHWMLNRIENKMHNALPEYKTKLIIAIKL